MQQGFSEEQLLAARPARGSGFGASPSRPPVREQQPSPSQQPARTQRDEEAPQFQPEPETTRSQQSGQMDDGLDIPTFLRNRQRRK